jgi:hypothetical protein
MWKHHVKMDVYAYAFAPEHDLILGAADLATLGFAIVGYQFPQQLRDEEFDTLKWDNNEDVNPPNSLEHDILHKQFLVDIAPHIALNQKIDPSSHCTIPSARVTIPLLPGNEIPRFVCQYYTGPVKAAIIQAKVDEWIQNKVVVKAPPGCR